MLRSVASSVDEDTRDKEPEMVMMMVVDDVTGEEAEHHLQLTER